MAPAPQLWATVETPDGIGFPGPHCTSAATRFSLANSSGVYLIEDDGEALLVDTGHRTSSSGVLDTLINAIDSRSAELEYIVQTHYHFDHIGHTEYLQDRYNAAVLCHPRERPVLDDPSRVTDTEYIEDAGGDPTLVAKELHLDSEESLAVPKEIFRTHLDFPVDVDDTVTEGTTVRVGELEIEFLHTPGHTPGHLSLFVPSSKSLYLADVMYWPTPLSPHPIGKAAEQISSIEKCLELDAAYLFPGHGLHRCGQDDVRDYLRDLLLKQLQLENRMLMLLGDRGPLTIPELHPEVFVIKSRYDYAADGRFNHGYHCIHSHLRRLLDDGRVRRVDDQPGGIAWQLSAAEAARSPDDRRNPRTIEDLRA